MQYERPSGPMHVVLRKASDELRVHNNPFSCISVITAALSNCDISPTLERILSESATDSLPGGSGSGARGSTGGAIVLSADNGVYAAGDANVHPSNSTSLINRSSSTGTQRPSSTTSNPPGGLHHGSFGSPPATPLFGVGTTGVGSAFVGAQSVRATAASRPVTTSPNAAGNASNQSSNARPAVLLQGFVVGGGATDGSTRVSAKSNQQQSSHPNAQQPQQTGRRFTFNALQLVRLLLLRCEAYGFSKQHDKALVDARAAVDISQGQHPEAFFYMGRELRKLFRIEECVRAFEAGEAVMLAIARAYLSGSIKISDGVVQGTPVTDEEFWAMRGFQMSDIDRLSLVRSSVENQEALSLRQRQEAQKFPHAQVESGAGSRLPNRVGSPVCPGGSYKSALTFPRADFTETDNVPGGSSNVGGHHRSASLRRTDSSCTVSSTSNEDGSDELTRAFTTIVKGGPESETTQSLQVFGMPPGEINMWRRRAKESRALHAMHRSHTIPAEVSSTMLLLLDRRISGVRCGIAVAIENSTSSPLRLVTLSSPDSSYNGNYSFARSIPVGHCGIGLLQPKSSWSGFSGTVVYEADESLCCFLYFDSSMVKAVRFGARFVRVRACDVERAQTEGEPVTGRHSTSAAGQSLALQALQNPSYSAIHASPLTTSSQHAKVSCYLYGAQTLFFSLTQTLPVYLRSVELLTALEFAGPIALKKLSAVSRRYRDLVNSLPPPLLYGGSRHVYPDYCIAQDCVSSPWTVRDKEAITWRLVYEGRVFDKDEFVIVDDSDQGSHAIFCVTADVHTRMVSTFYYGDRRCPQLQVKESWMPFSSTRYLVTPLGRTLGMVSQNTTQGQCTLTLNSFCEKDETPFYTARRRESMPSNNGGGASGGAFSSNSPPTRLGIHAPASASEGGVSGQGQGRSMGLGTPSGSRTTIATGKLGDPSGNRGGNTPIQGNTSRIEHYSIWRPQRVSGASTALSSAAHTNHGADVVAELSVLSPGNQPLMKGVVLGHAKLLPGADALLVCTMLFCIVRS